MPQNDFSFSFSKKYIKCLYFQCFSYFQVFHIFHNFNFHIFLHDDGTDDDGRTTTDGRRRTDDDGRTNDDGRRRTNDGRRRRTDDGLNDGRTDDDGRTTTTDDDGRRRTDGKAGFLKIMKNIRENTCFYISVVVENSFSQNSRKISKRNLVIKPSKIHRQKMLYPDLCRIFHAEFGYTISFVASWLI